MNYMQSVAGGISRVVNSVVASPVAQLPTQFSVTVEIIARMHEVLGAMLAISAASLVKLSAKRHSISGHGIARAVR